MDAVDPTQKIAEEAISVPTPIAEEQRRRIFLSYGHDENAPLAQQLKKDLEARGHEVWFDDRLKTGADWEIEIEKGLQWVSADKARARLVLLITPYSVRRPNGYCLNELSKALAMELPVLPVVLVSCEPPLSIFRIQRLDMRDCVPLQDRHECYEKKLHLLAEALELDSKEALAFDTLDARLQACLQPLDYGADINRHLVEFTGRKWVFDEVAAWLTAPKSSRVLCLTGWAGTGKSAIAAYLCAKWPEVAAFHICVYGHTQKADPRHCVSSIAYQLSSQLPTYLERLSGLNLESLTKDSNAQALFDGLIVQPLGTNFPHPGRNVVIVIDALDEASQGDTNDLADFIASAFERCPAWLRLIVTSRPVAEVVTPLQGMATLQLDTKRPENADDIREYAKRVLKALTANTDVLAEAAETIVNRSEGVFLYAYWVCEELKRGHLSVEQPEAFPQALGGAYFKFFQRQFKNLTTYKKEVRPVLGVIAAAYDSVPEQVLSEIFQWDDLQRKEFFDPLKALFPCVQGRYRPFHLSIIDWLADLSDNGAGAYCVSVQGGHKLLADYCLAECAGNVQGDRPLRDLYQKYAFRHGVRHFVESGRFADAVELLDYLIRHQKDLKPDEQSDLNQLSKIVTIALGEHEPEKAEAERISAKKFAGLLKGLYMTEPLYGGIRLLLKYHPAEWRDIREDFLASDDYVLRHTIAEAMAADYLTRGQDARWEEIRQLAESQELNHRELGAYALQEVYEQRPDLIEPKYLNLLANGDTYPFRSALGDLLLGLALADIGSGKFDRLEIMNLVDASSLFWNPIWNFNRMDVAWLRAIDYFARNEALPADAPNNVRKAHEALVRTKKQRKELLDRPDVKTSEPLSNLLSGYYQLGLKPEEIRAAESSLKAHAASQPIFEALFAHPLWLITEEAASVLASIIDENPSASRHISDLFQHDLWRVQYGAAEAAFLARFKNKNVLFRKSVNAFYRHEEPLLRGNCAENLAAWILDSSPSERRNLLNDFKSVISEWLRNDDEDAWVLDHVYRLFSQLKAQGHEADFLPLLADGVSRLLEGDPVWYTLSRQDFLLRIEKRKREQPNGAASARVV